MPIMELCDPAGGIIGVGGYHVNNVPTLKH